MTTQTTTIGQEKQGLRGVLAMTAATVALVGGVLLWQVRPTGDAAVPTTTSRAELQAGAGTWSSSRATIASMGDMEDAMTVASVPVDTLGGMAELYREQQAADQSRTRGICGEEEQSLLC